MNIPAVTIRGPARRAARWLRRGALLSLALVSVGCTGPSGRHWGFDAKTLKRVGRAAFDAAVSPEVLVPAVAIAST